MERKGLNRLQERVDHARRTVRDMENLHRYAEVALRQAAEIGLQTDGAELWWSDLPKTVTFTWVAWKWSRRANGQKDGCGHGLGDVSLTIDQRGQRTWKWGDRDPKQVSATMNPPIALVEFVKSKYDLFQDWGQGE